MKDGISGITGYTNSIKCEHVLNASLVAILREALLVTSILRVVDMEIFDGTTNSTLLYLTVENFKAIR